MFLFSELQVIFCLALITLYLESPCSGSVSSSKGIPIQLAKTDRGGPGRTNSRFLRTFPVSLNYYPAYARRETYNEIQSPHELVNGNSPVFYIRLPPAPYILVPGLGYVSPHPYNSPMAMGMPSPGKAVHEITKLDGLLGVSLIIRRLHSNVLRHLVYNFIFILDAVMQNNGGKGQ